MARYKLMLTTEDGELVETFYVTKSRGADDEDSFDISHSMARQALVFEIEDAIDRQERED